MARSIIFVNASGVDWSLTRFGGILVPATGTYNATEVISDDELMNAIQKGLAAEFDTEHYLRINGVDWSPSQSASYGDQASAVTSGNHAGLRQLIHFIDNGPAEDFLSGAYKEVTGTVFPTAIIWYDKAGAGKKKIVEKIITWTGANPTTIVWKVYDTSEVLLATVTDTITYSGPFETSRTRTIA